MTGRINVNCFFHAVRHTEPKPSRLRHALRSRIQDHRRPRYPANRIAPSVKNISRDVQFLHPGNHAVRRNGGNGAIGGRRATRVVRRPGDFAFFNTGPNPLCPTTSAINSAKLPNLLPRPSTIASVEEAISGGGVYCLGSAHLHLATIVTSGSLFWAIRSSKCPFDRA